MPLIRCPYHSWCYSHEGKLKKTPHIGGSGQDTHPDFTATDKNLFPVRHGVYMGVVFVNPSGEAEDFDDYIQPVRDFWHEFSGVELYSHESDTSFDFHLRCNWKFGVENFCESYHLPWVHPALNSYSKLEDHYNIASKTYSGQGTVVYQPMLDSAGRRFHQLTDLSDKWQTGGEYLSIYPNLLYGVHRDHSFAVITIPQNVDNCYEQGELFYFNQEAVSDDYSSLRQRMMENWYQVFKEDVSVVEGMQKGRKSVAFDGGAFSPVMDGPSHCFHKWMAEKMQNVEF